MKKNSFKIVCCAAALFAAAGLRAQGKHDYKVAASYHIASDGGWDYIAVGPGNNRLYVSHATQVNILDQRTGDSVGVIPNTTGVHGIAFAAALHKGYTSNGKLNNISVFDVSTNKVITQIPSGEKPDAIMYEPFSKTIVVCNGKSNDLTVIDPATDKVVATIPVGGKPETAVSDGKGKVFVNIEDKNEIVAVNISAKKVESHWPLGAEGPTGLAIDPASNRLFAGCDNVLVVVDYTSGKVIRSVGIGADCDGVAFNAAEKNIFAACGEGTLDIIHEDSPDKYTLIHKLPTKKSARTLTVDETQHAVYLPAADLGAPVAGQKRPPMMPGSFQVIVVK